LATHIEDVTNLLFYEGLSGVFLVGNSYGGMVITGVAAKEPRRLAHVVYLDAYVPFDGENEMSLWPPEELARVKEEITKGNKFRPLPPIFQHSSA
jgi:pimeloyl-ACP methyl ester carboxylesterase